MDDLSAFSGALRAGAQPTVWNSQGMTLFHQVCQTGQSAHLDLLLRAHPNHPLDQALPDGRTGLHIAIVQQNTASAMWLLEHGANPNLVGVAGQTALHMAARHGSLVLLRALTARGARWDIKDIRQQTPLDVLRHYHPTRARLGDTLASNSTLN